MKSIRIGNDIRVSWGITTNKQKVSLVKDELSLQLVVFNHVYPITDFIVTDNVVTFTFLAKKQTYCGIYTLVLKQVKDGKESTVDKTDAFRLVPHSQEEDGLDNPSVALEVVVLNTDIDSTTIGRAATVRVGKVDTLPAGGSAYVVNSGTINDAVLDFGIPVGYNGADAANGEDGLTLYAEPGAVTFQSDSDGTISEGQSQVVSIRYEKGSESAYANIKSLSVENLKEVMPINSDGHSFTIQGSNVTTTNVTDADGNVFAIPASNAFVTVKCTIPNGTKVYTIVVPIYTSTSEFVSRVFRSQKEFRQEYEELAKRQTEQGDAIEQYKSTFEQTARKIEMTVEANKTEADGSIEKLQSQFTITAEEIKATVSDYKTETDGTIEDYRSEWKQTAQEITTTVEANKKDADDNLTSAKSEWKQTAEEITTRVEKYQETTNGTISSMYSEIQQSSSQIDLLTAKITFDSDGNIANINKSGLLTTADSTEIYARIETAEGKIVSESSIKAWIEDGLAKVKIYGDDIIIDANHAINITSPGSLVIDTANFKLDQNGQITANNGIFTGTVNAEGGTIGDAVISKVKGNTTIGVGRDTAMDYYTNGIRWESGIASFRSRKQSGSYYYHTRVTGGEIWVSKSTDDLSVSGYPYIKLSPDEGIYYAGASGSPIFQVTKDSSFLSVILKGLPTSRTSAAYCGLYNDNGTLKIYV